MPFTHLAARTCYSLRDGVIRPRELAEAVAARSMSAVGIADRDGLYGAVRLAQACAEAGVQPIYGADLALADDQGRPGWEDRRRGARTQALGGGRQGPSSGAAWLDGDPARVVLIARTQHGYANLARTISAAHLEHDRGDPELAWEQLGRRADGMLVLLGDDSPVGRLLDAGRVDAAEAEARRWMDLAGPSSVLVGITHHLAPPGGAGGHGPPVPSDDHRARRRFALADRLGLRAVANQVPRYLDPADARVADVMDAVRGQVPLGPRTTTRRNAEGYLKAPEEMARVFGERPDALTNAAWVAERCAVDLGLGQLRVPDFAGGVGGSGPPREWDRQAELRSRCEAGLAERYAGGGGQVHRERLDTELAMIARLGLAPYFLTVAEIVERIRSKGIMVACRGSAAGSIITYALRISDVDPIAHDLAFERFANPYRDELPDIDIDVESARREDIYRDLLDRYGSERVACVCMVETFQARMAIREAGKALGLPPEEIDVIAKSFPRVRARDVRTALAHLPELKGRTLDVGAYTLLFDVVERLDGLPRHIALHPSGVLLGAALPDLAPMESSAHGFAMVQFDKDDVEALGLCKLDVLAVRMLSSIAHCLDEVRRTRGVEVDLDAVPTDDPDTFALIRSTRTLGMFQIESPGQRELVGKLQPVDVSDLIVDISLFRPGPVKGDMVTPFVRRRHGHEPTPKIHPLVDEVLADTHGVIVFHEQVMRCVAAITGCDLSTADLVRRRLDDPEKLPVLRRWVLGEARRRGIDEQAAQRLWDTLAEFASFGFCKAHAAAFAVPTYRSAWLKRHFLPEFVAGLLTHDPGMYPRRLLLDDARQLGVAVLPLDVNHSAREYRVERVAVCAPMLTSAGISAEANTAPDLGGDPDDPGVRFGVRLGLADVAGIDDAMIESLLAGRPFTSVTDLRRRSALSAPIAEALTHAGALDEIGGVAAGARSRRDVLLEVTERWSGLVRHRPADPAAPEQLGLLEADPAPGLRPYRPSEQVRAELEVLGLDASTHVVRFYDGLLDVLGVLPARDLLRTRNGQRVRVAGVKVATQTPPIRSGQRIIFLSLDDGTGVSDATFFESVHERCAATVFHSWLLVVDGRVRRTGARGVSINAEAAWDLAVLMGAWREGRLDEALRAPGPGATEPARKLWHASGGSAGR